MPKYPFNADDAFLFESLLGEEERMIMEAAREYAQTRLEPRALEGNQEGIFHDEIPREMAELGLLGATVDPKYGGAGVSYTAYGLIARELERVDSGYRSFASVQSSLVMYPIQTFGPDHGSDPGSMTTTATRAEGGWRLNGAKMWITNSPVADVAVVWAKTRGTEGDDGVIRGFLVERDMELRDALLRSLGRHTVSELADINARDFLTDELKVALQSVLQLKVNRILIPQFVIQ